MEALQRPAWTGSAIYLGDVFRLHRGGSCRPLRATCSLFSHESGWELRLDIDGGQRSLRVCRSQNEVLSAAEQWKASMVEKGWR